MKKTYYAYKLIFQNKTVFYLSLIFLALSVLFISYNVLKIKSSIQDSILNVVSILFPLIAGFLTFGKEIINELNKKIETINKVSNSQIGRPTPDNLKKKIFELKNLASNFRNIIISTFFISFLLIIIILIAKFNSFEFKTSYIKDDTFQKFFRVNWVNFLIKIVFFSTLLTLFLNLSYLVYFIIQVNNQEDEK